jgi:hypothetical protein
MLARIAKGLICLLLPFCAAAGPPEEARVKDEAAAIALGKKKCTQDQPGLVRQDWDERKWRASYDPGGGYWWVYKPVSGLPIMGLLVLVSAGSGHTTSCDPEYFPEH